jgi:hypothetical protein
MNRPKSKEKLQACCGSAMRAARSDERLLMLAER